MTKIDWANITNYIESVGTTDTNFPFTKTQSSVKVTNGGGTANLIYTIGGQSGTLAPSQSVTVTGSITTMTLRASVGKQAFQVLATEANTEKEYTDVDVVASLAGKVSTVNGIAPDASGNVSISAGGNSILYNVKSSPYNAKGDGSTDDTSAIQNCLNACASAGDGYVYIPKGTYMINAVTSLVIPSNIRIVLEPQAVLKVIANNSTTYSVFKINNVSNVFIEGNGAILQGDRTTHTTAPAWQNNHSYVVNDQVNANGYILKCTTAGTSGATMPTCNTGSTINDNTVVWTYVYSGENGMMVNITGSTNVFISNLKCKDGWGDGFYVGGSSYCENIYLTNCTADNNRRNGLSITNCKTCIILGGQYKNTSGTNPQFGIDVEPNASCVIENVLIKGVKTAANCEGGIALIPILMKGGTYNFDVTVEDWLSEGDGLPQSQTYGIGLLLDNNSSTNSRVGGKIEIRKASIVTPDGMGVYIQGWNNNPKTHFADVVVYNSNTYTAGYTPDQAGFGMDYNSNDPTGVVYGNITFERCGTIDTRGTKVSKYAFAFVSVSGRPFNNIVFIDPIYDGVTTSWISWGVPDTSSGFIAKFNTQTMVNVSSSQALTNYAGQTVNATAAITLTMPSANNIQGAEYTVVYGAASGTVTIALQSGDSIIHKGTSVTTLALTVAGTFAKLRSIGGNKFVVVEHNIS